MSIKKQYLKGKEECKITFRFEKSNDINLNSVRIVGDFNNWNSNTEPMKKLKSGDFTQILQFPKGQSIQFRYLVNDSVWVNDSESDGYVNSGVTPEEHNCLLHI